MFYVVIAILLGIAFGSALNTWAIGNQTRKGILPKSLAMLGYKLPENTKKENNSDKGGK